MAARVQLQKKKKFSIRDPRRAWRQDKLLLSCWVSWEKPVESGGDSEEEERPSLKAATKQRLVKTEKTLSVHPAYSNLSRANLYAYKSVCINSLTQLGIQQL
jgi:ribosomal protein L39E